LADFERAQKQTKMFCEKVKKSNADINAIVDLDEAGALKKAGEVDKRIKKDTSGSLAGLVLAIKSNINVKGFRGSCASNTLTDYVAGYDATVIERLSREDVF
jgi:aspartyl-tRNA(Asn)/glutamyl-tRNA(Gln) amidotransferase subunit A